MNKQKIINTLIVFFLVVAMGAYLWLQLFNNPGEQVAPADLIDDIVEDQDSSMSGVYDLEIVGDKSIQLGETITITTNGPLAITYDSVINDGRCDDELNCDEESESLTVQVLVSTMSETNVPYELTYEEPLAIGAYTVELADFSTKDTDSENGGPAVLFTITPTAELTN